MAAKKSRSVGSANAAEKRVMDKKAQRSRTDAAGRSGMGETATSNVRFKGGKSMSAANRTALAAASKASKSGGSPTTAFQKSLSAAGKAAYVDAPALRKKALARAAAETMAKKKK